MRRAAVQFGEMLDATFQRVIDVEITGLRLGRISKM